MLEFDFGEGVGPLDINFCRVPRLQYGITLIHSVIREIHSGVFLRSDKDMKDQPITAQSQGTVLTTVVRNEVER